MITWQQLAEMPVLAEFARLTGRLFGLTLSISCPRQGGKGYMRELGSLRHANPLCQAVVSHSHATMAHCHAGSAAHARLAAKSLRMVRYICHMGHREYIFPIVVDGELVAFLMTGMFLDGPPTAAGWRRVERRLRKLGMVPDRQSLRRLRGLYLRSKVVSPQAQKDLVSLIDIFTKHTAVTHAKMLESQQDPQERVVSKAIEFLKGRCLADLRVDDVAAAAGVSRRSLVRVFPKKTGRSVTDYLRRLRVDHACRQLRAGDTKVIDVALRCGIPNLPTFNRTFRKLTGVTPRQWRKQARHRQS